MARTLKYEETKRRTDGISLFLIDTDRDGVTHNAIEKLGTNTQSSSTIFFDNVRVEQDEVIGTLHGGWGELLDVLNTERIVTTAGLIGTIELAVRLAVDYANGRKVFGDTPISSYQGAVPLAQAHAEMECARLMNRHAALFDAGLPFGSQANVAKLIAAQACSAATERAMQTRAAWAMRGPCRTAVARLSSVPLRAGLRGDDPQLHRPARARHAAVLLRQRRTEE